MGLYRDDGPAIFRNTSGLEVERIRKNIFKTFQQHGLQVTTEANMIETDFLDITLNLSSGKFWRIENLTTSRFTFTPRLTTLLS